MFLLFASKPRKEALPHPPSLRDFGLAPPRFRPAAAAGQQGLRE
jgi:hypothetical protein